MTYLSSSLTSRITCITLPLSSSLLRPIKYYYSYGFLSLPSFVGCKSIETEIICLVAEEEEEVHSV